MQNENGRAIHVQSIAVGDGQIACFQPRETATDAELILNVMRRITALYRCNSFPVALPLSSSSFSSRISSC